ncbi:LysE family translocator [Carnobacterium maltaromaticum]|uniref:LysE family translocator n=1 Tax=Carnobacterium maltaromaticum TaxID=2751 RepID=UPI00295F0881|nr:LysE family transporter [Carnobacterium maltaromaticum]
MLVFKGFKFGMILQLAIGPICLYTFQIANTYGFARGFQITLAVSIADSIFIILASFGVGKILENVTIKKLFTKLASVILIFFGCLTIFNSFKTSQSIDKEQVNFFFRGFLLTISNPLTILFWSSFFGVECAKNDWNKKETIIFSFGCILATFIFLTIISFLGHFTSNFLSNSSIQLMNIIVGLLIVYFGITKLKNEGIKV